MRVPRIYYADDIKDFDYTVDINGRYVLARPKGYGGIFLLWRLRNSWKVFIGDVDVLAWKGGQSRL